MNRSKGSQPLACRAKWTTHRSAMPSACPRRWDNEVLEGAARAGGVAVVITPKQLAEDGRDSGKPRARKLRPGRRVLLLAHQHLKGARVDGAGSLQRHAPLL